ncbi:type IV pilus biogenesis protein PilM [Bacillus massiliigorillae]|uniref:type IV pilus biogenesis protein PilM n=1 Tax=Bacillus massiliigorillae TaxID=1243664 RepID=UPI0003A772C6|nr:pilus assembly protein PilM [Bacillus massiliigorillae]
MALSLFSRNSKIVNLEIKDYVIRFADVRPGKNPTLHRGGEYLLPLGIVKNGKIVDFETLKMILLQCIEDWKISKREVRFLLPDKSVFMRKIRIPKDVAENEIEGYIYLQLGTSIHLPFEAPYFDFFVLGEVGEEKEILLFAAPEDLVMQYKQLLEECKLKPVVADLAPLAMYRLYNAIENVNANMPLLSLYFSLFDVDASIFLHHKPQFMRNIMIPIEQELWERATNRKGEPTWLFTREEDIYIDMLEDAFIEIDRILSFYKFNMNQGNQEVSKIMISGDHPLLHRIVDCIRKRYNLDVGVIHEEKISVDQQDLEVSSYCLPIGLALRGGK